MDALANMRELSPYFENPWIQSLGIFILSLVLTVIIRWSLRFILLAVVQKTKTEVDDIVIRAVKKLVTYSVPVIGLMVALTPLALTTSIPQRTLFSLLAVLVIRAAISLVEDLSRWMEKTWVKRTDSTLDDGLLPLVRKAVKDEHYHPWGSGNPARMGSPDRSYPGRPRYWRSGRWPGPEQQPRQHFRRHSAVIGWFSQCRG